MKKRLALCALLLLAACGNQRNPIVEAAWDEAQGLYNREPAGKAGNTPQKPLRRADIEAQNIAAIWAKLGNDPAPTLLYATAKNGAYVTYFSNFRQSIILNELLVTATRGLGWDLLSAWSSANDPVVHPTPPGRWPLTVERNYQFRDIGPEGRIETYKCSLERGATREQVILERRIVGVEFSEACTGPAGHFENLYFADATTGFVWRSLQWVGPRMPLIDIQVLEPYN